MMNELIPFFKNVCLKYILRRSACLLSVNGSASDVSLLSFCLFLIAGQMQRPSEKKFEVAKYVGLMILRCS